MTISAILYLKLLLYGERGTKDEVLLFLGGYDDRTQKD